MRPPVSFERRDICCYKEEYYCCSFVAQHDAQNAADSRTMNMKPFILPAVLEKNENPSGTI